MRFTRYLAAVALVAAALLTPSPVAAASPPWSAVEALTASLGDRTGGAYYDAPTRTTVVTVTDPADAAAVRRAGATPRLVERSGADLARVTEALNREARIPGTAWAVDIPTNQVVVSYDDTVTGATLARLTSVTGRFGSAVRTERIAGTLDTRISGGQVIYSGSSRCSLAFNVRNSAGTQFFVTVGHCTNLGISWYGAGNVYLGYRTGTSFPGNDYGIVRYDSTVARPGNLFLYNGTYQDITSAANGYIGQSVCHVGSTSGRHCGSITALNATVTYPQGSVYGLIRTNICSEPGDSGGALYAGTVAIGIISGGSGNCTTGGTTYYQPITEVLSVYGVNVY